MQIGRSNQSTGNADTRNLHRPADAWVHAPTNEVFVADGYGIQSFTADGTLLTQLVKPDTAFARNVARWRRRRTACRS